MDGGTTPNRDSTQRHSPDEGSPDEGSGTTPIRDSTQQRVGGNPETESSDDPEIFEQHYVDHVLYLYLEFEVDSLWKKARHKTQIVQPRRGQTDKTQPRRGQPRRGQMYNPDVGPKEKPP